MENEFRVIDIILSVILAVVMSIGIGIHFVKQANDPKELTMENYEEYLDVTRTCVLAISKETECTIIFRPATRFKVTDAKVTLSIEGESINSQVVEVSFSATHDEPYAHKITLKSNLPPSSIDASIDRYRIYYKVISISGQLSRG